MPDHTSCQVIFLLFLLCNNSGPAACDFNTYSNTLCNSERSGGGRRCALRPRGNIVFGASFTIGAELPR